MCRSSPCVEAVESSEVGGGAPAARRCLTIGAAERTRARVRAHAQSRVCVCFSLLAKTWSLARYGRITRSAAKGKRERRICSSSSRSCARSSSFKQQRPLPPPSVTTVSPSLPVDDAHSTLEMSRQSAKSSSAAERRRRLVHFHELPPWAHDNEFIRSGYRAPGGTKDAWKVQGNNSRAPNGATLDSSGRGVTGTALEQRAVSRRGKANGNSNDQVAALDGQDGLSDIQEHSSFTVRPPFLEPDGPRKSKVYVLMAIFCLCLQRCWKSVWLYAHNETGA